MSEKYPSDEADRFMVRMPPGMRDRIAEAAKAAGRSMNAEIVLRLMDSFEQRRDSDVVQEKLQTTHRLLQKVLDDVAMLAHRIDRTKTRVERSEPNKNTRKSDD